MDAPAKPASLGALSPVQGVHPQTSEDDFPPLKSPFSKQAPGHDDRSQGGGTVPCPGLDAAMPPGPGKDWRQWEGEGRGSEWGEGSNQA